MEFYDSLVENESFKMNNEKVLWLCGRKCTVRVVTENQIKTNEKDFATDPA